MYIIVIFALNKVFMISKLKIKINKNNNLITSNRTKNYSKTNK